MDTLQLDERQIALSRGSLGPRRPVVNESGEVIGEAAPSGVRVRADGRSFGQCRAGGALVGCEIVAVGGGTKADGCEIVDIGDGVVLRVRSGKFSAPWPLDTRADALRYFNIGVKHGAKAARLLGWSGYGAAAAAASVVDRVVGLMRDGRVCEDAGLVTYPVLDI